MAATTLTTGITAHIAVTDGIPTTTTLDIAEVYGKRHDHVLRIVRQRMAEAPEEWRLPNFGEAVTERANPSGGEPIKSPVIRMTKKGFHFVVGKFTGAKAVQHQIAFADEFERMEAELAGKALSPAAAPALAAPQHSAQHCEAAVMAGGVASLQVQMALARAVLDGGDAWKHQRWLISFGADSQVGTAPVVQLLPADSLVLGKDEVIRLAGNIAGDVWKEMRNRLANTTRS